MQDKLKMQRSVRATWPLHAWAKAVVVLEVQVQLVAARGANPQSDKGPQGGLEGQRKNLLFLFLFAETVCEIIWKLYRKTYLKLSGTLFEIIRNFFIPASSQSPGRPETPNLKIGRSP
jgi:hypothetical protein